MAQNEEAGVPGRNPFVNQVFVVIMWKFLINGSSVIVAIPS